MYCQNCGAVDDGGVRCSLCGANDYGPNKPELTQEQIDVQSNYVRSNQIQHIQPSSGGISYGAASGIGIAIVIALITFGGTWLFGVFG